MAPRVTRRTFLTGTAGAAGIAAFGAIGLVGYSDSDIVRSTLRRLIGGFRMNDADLEAFTRDFRSDFLAFDGMKAHLIRLSEFSGITPIAAKTAPGPIADRIENFERALLTNFVMTTDFLETHGGNGGRLTYRGQSHACNNPFARTGGETGTG